MCEECKPVKEEQPTIKVSSGTAGDTFGFYAEHMPFLSTIDPYSHVKKNARTYLNVAKEFAELVKYDGTKVGCVLVKDGNMISHGINGYPKRVNDTGVNKLDREERLKLAIHAEENALLKLMETGQSPLGAVAYVTHHPCIKCAARLYSAGVYVVVMPKQDEKFLDLWIRPDNEAYNQLASMHFVELDFEL